MCESTIIWVACTQLPRDIVSHRLQTFGGRLICLTCSFVIISHRHELTKKLCASSTGKLFHVTTPLRLFHYGSSQMGALSTGCMQIVSMQTAVKGHCHVRITFFWQQVNTPSSFIIAYNRHEL